MSEFEIVDRPSRQNSANTEDIDAVIATATTGKAVRLALNGRPLHAVRERFYHACRIRGYQGHVRQDNEAFVTVWATKPEPKQ